jgi:hypothetical protein
MVPCKSKLNGEKSNHTGLAQQTVFGTAFVEGMLRLAKVAAKPNTCCAYIV